MTFNKIKENGNGIITETPLRILNHIRLANGTWENISTQYTKIKQLMRNAANDAELHCLLTRNSIKIQFEWMFHPTTLTLQIFQLLKQSTLQIRVTVITDVS